MSFVHLNVHSSHSLLSGASTVEDLVWAAAKHGMEALALTDTNGLYAAVPFQRACAEAGVRPIFGVEVDEPSGSEAPLGGPRSRAASAAIRFLHRGPPEAGLPIPNDASRLSPLPHPCV